MRNSKYTKEYIKEFIFDCCSIRCVLRNLGLKPDGGHKGLRELIQEVLIELKQYKGQAHARGKFGEYYIRKSNDELFCKSSRTSWWNLKMALFNRGIKKKQCESCKLSEWMGKPIPLELHHVDGDKYNNELSNLQILCPNCHTFTDNYKIKNRNDL